VYELEKEKIVDHCRATVMFDWLKPRFMTYQPSTVNKKSNFHIMNT
jgi:hypothetical protein